MDLIPCEFCDRYISFDIYNIHISTCRIFSSIRTINRNVLNNPPIQEIGAEQEETEIEGETEEHNDETENNNADDELDSDTDTDPDMPELDMPELEDYSEPQMPELEPFINEPAPNFFVFNGETNLNSSFSLFNIPNTTTINDSNNIDDNLNVQINRLQFFRNIINNINSTSSYNTNLNNEYENNSNLEERIGKVTIGIKDLSLISEDYELDKEEECIICREEFEKKSIIKKLKCNHYFCENCIKTWFNENTKCPVCQNDFNDNKNIIINK